MEKTPQCECGFEAHAESDDGLAAEIQRHAVEAQGMALSAEQALLLAVRGQLSKRRGLVGSRAKPPTKPREIPN